MDKFVSRSGVWLVVAAILIALSAVAIDCLDREDRAHSVTEPR